MRNKKLFQIFPSRLNASLPFGSTQFFDFKLQEVELELISLLKIEKTYHFDLKLALKDRAGTFSCGPDGRKKRFA